MKYTVYKTINKINGKFYIGMHRTNNPYDSYMGSGSRLKSAIKKYGKHNFEKEVLFIFDNEYEMLEKEKQLINEIIFNENSYNILNGNIGMHSGEAIKNKWNDSEYRKMMTDNMTNKWNDDNFRNMMSRRSTERLKKNWECEEYRKKMNKIKAEKVSKTKSEMISMYHEKDSHNNRFVHYKNVEEYLQNGWNFGTKKQPRDNIKKDYDENKIRKLKMYHENDEMKFRLISQCDIEKYYIDGWKFYDKKYQNMSINEIKNIRIGRK